MKSVKNNNTLTVFPEGRIDTNNAPKVEAELMEAVKAAPGCELVIDADKLKYISSAGLRVLMKLRKLCGGSMSIVNVSPEVYDVFDVTGFTEMMRVEKRFRELSVEGCEVIGRGFVGTVYRIDEETIVKVYNSPDSLPMIRNEQRLAKKAFVKGVPTAIPYDIVRVGDKLGTVFELLNAGTFNDILIKEPERFEEVLDMYAGAFKTIHGVEMDPGTMPMARDNALEWLLALEDYLPREQLDRFRALLSAMPDDLRIIHGDMQMKNIMLVGDEPMLIDMDTLSTGQPVFDLQGVYVTYVAFPEDEPGNLRSFLGIPDELGGKIWQGVIRRYFPEAGEDELTGICEKIMLTGTVRFLYLVVSSPGLRDTELGAKRIARARERIAQLLPKVSDLLL